MTNLYGGGVRQTIRRWVIALGLLAIMFFCTWRLFSTVPSSFVPPEDQGYILVAAILPDGASLDRAENVCDRISEIFTKEPEVKDASTFAGYSLLDNQLKARAGTLFVSLKDFHERKSAENSAFALINRVRPKLASIKEAMVIPVNPPSIPGLGAQGGFEFWIQSRGQSDAARLQETRCCIPSQSWSATRACRSQRDARRCIRPASPSSGPSESRDSWCSGSGCL